MAYKNKLFRKALDQARGKAYSRIGTGSLVLDAAKGLTGMGISGIKRLRNVIKGTKVPASQVKKQTKDTLDKAFYKFHGRPTAIADEAVGKQLGKVPVVGNAFKTTEKFDDLVDNKLLKKIKSGSKLSGTEKSLVDLQLKGHQTYKATEPIRKAGKIVVPVAGGIALSNAAQKRFGDDAQKNKGQGMPKMASDDSVVPVEKKLLLKTAAHIRTLEQDRDKAVDEVTELRKLAEAQQKVFHLLHEGLIDLDNVEEKVAELKEHPERSESFFDTPNYDGFGQIKQAAAGTVPSNPLEEFLLTGDFTNGS